jgi:hypothetical protein
MAEKPPDAVSARPAVGITARMVVVDVNELPLDKSTAVWLVRRRAA